MNLKWKNEQGTSLLEIILLIIIIGVALPSLFTVIGKMSTHHARNEILMNAVHFAETELEEVVAFKKTNDDWTSSIQSFQGSENLSGGYSRNVNVTQISNWISSGVEAYQVEVTVSHSKLPNGYSLTVVLVSG